MMVYELRKIMEDAGDNAPVVVEADGRRQVVSATVIEGALILTIVEPSTSPESTLPAWGRS